MLTHINLDGETRLAGIIGDPIAQVKSPGALTASLNQRHKNWIVVPLHISPEDVSSFLHGIGLLKNFDGFVATIPHNRHLGSARRPRRRARSRRRRAD